MKFLAALLLLGSHALRAQQLQGSIRDSVFGEPVSGVVVLLLDADGQPVRRTITNERGQYKAALDSTVRQLRLLRLGFRPRDVAVPARPSESVRIDVVIVSIPRFLDAVDVRENPLCPRRSDQATAFAMWQQARIGLLATVVAREENPARLFALTYQRPLIGTSDTFSQQRVHTHGGLHAVAFGAALTPAQFLQKGFFAVDPDGGHVFYGPDAEVLLSEPFQAEYCFATASDLRGRVGQVGLRFSPAKRPRGRVDIDGTLWIDTARRMLRDIEYRYLGLPSASERFRPGGRVSFREMPAGLVMVDQWSIRAVSTGRAPTSGLSRNDPSPFETTNRRFVATDNGGEIARADWPDGRSWRASLGTLRLRLIDSTGAAVAGVRVQLDSTDYTAVSDSSGLAEIQNLLPGPYVAVVVDSAIASIGMKLNPPYEFVASRDSVLTQTLIVLTEADVIAAGCGRNANTKRVSSVIGRVVTSDDSPVKGAGWEVAGSRGFSDSQGIFKTCAARDSTAEVHVWRKPALLRSSISKTVKVTFTNAVTVIRIELPH